jgi:hypothetical protein
MKSVILWDVTPYSMAEVQRRIEWAYCHHLQDRKMKMCSFLGRFQRFRGDFWLHIEGNKDAVVLATLIIRI